MTKHFIASAPDGLLEAIKQAADKSNVSQADWLRTTVAKAVGYKGELTSGRTVRKYASDEERKAAEKERRLLKNKLYKAHLAEQAAASVAE